METMRMASPGSGMPMRPGRRVTAMGTREPAGPVSVMPQPLLSWVPSSPSSCACTSNGSGAPPETQDFRDEKSTVSTPGRFSSATHMVGTAAYVTRIAYEQGGGAALFLDNPLQRRFREAHAMTQHVMVQSATMELAGRVLLGLPTDASLL